jgi:hypothetical protein
MGNQHRDWQHGVVVAAVAPAEYAVSMFLNFGKG